MRKTAEEWNEEFEETRMKYLGHTTKTAAPSGVAWRRFAKGLIISEDYQILRISHKNLMDKKWHKGVNITDQYTWEERRKIALKAFPLKGETLWKS